MSLNSDTIFKELIYQIKQKMMIYAEAYTKMSDEEIISLENNTIILFETALLYRKHDKIKSVLEKIKTADKETRQRYLREIFSCAQ